MNARRSKTAAKTSFKECRTVFRSMQPFKNARRTAEKDVNAGKKRGKQAPSHVTFKLPRVLLESRNCIVIQVCFIMQGGILQAKLEHARVAGHAAATHAFSGIGIVNNFLRNNNYKGCNAASKTNISKQNNKQTVCLRLCCGGNTTTLLLL